MEHTCHSEEKNQPRLLVKESTKIIARNCWKNSITPSDVQVFLHAQAVIWAFR